MITPKSNLKNLLFLALVVVVASTIGVVPVMADNTLTTMPFSQNWTNVGLIITTMIGQVWLRSLAIVVMM
jgi:hypothetical protein